MFQGAPYFEKKSNASESCFMGYDSLGPASHIVEKISKDCD
jgi:hypothetical protein